MIRGARETMGIGVAVRGDCENPPIVLSTEAPYWAWAQDRPDDRDEDHDRFFTGILPVPGEEPYYY